MSKFDTKLVDQIKAREEVEQLVIDGVACLDAYQKELEKHYQSELRNIYKYIEYAANGNSLPDKKMKKYGSSDGVTEYEFKSDHLRVWAIQQPNKKVVILGGYKNSQPADERRFWSRKKQFLDSLKEKK